MKPDLIKTAPHEVGDITVDYHTGKLNGIMITGGGNFADRVTVKLRDDRETLILANRLPVPFIQFLTDLYYGNYGGNVIGNAVEFAFKELAADVPAAQDALNAFRGLTAHTRAMYLPLGNIDLDDKEIEVTYESTSQKDNAAIEIATMHLNDGPDMYLNYDQTNDSNITVKGIRQVFLLAKGSLVSDQGVFQDIDLQLDVKDGRNLLFKTSTILSSTNIFGGIEGYGDQRYARVYEETLPVPAEIRVKLTGAESAQTDLLFVREIIPDTVAESNLNNLDEITKRVARLEREDPNTAKNYRKAGLTVKAAQLDQTAKALDKN